MSSETTTRKGWIPLLHRLPLQARYRRSTETDNKNLAPRILYEIRGRIASGKFHPEDLKKERWPG